MFTESKSQINTFE